MEKYRKVEKVLTGKTSYDGAGVKLNRIFGFYEKAMFDPFLLLDFFGSDKPEDFISGFPWHPHRGIETVTYMLKGYVEHSDSIGNSGVIEKGDVQWMNAGSGIIHQEMPKSDSKRMYGFQLWVNLPATHKLSKPGYQEIKAKDIPEVVLENKVKVKIIAGEFMGICGPVRDIVANPSYFDISIPLKEEMIFETKADYTVFAFIYEGELYFDDLQNSIKTGECIFFGKGTQIKFKTANNSAKFLLVSGKPLKEPIAWQGPIVMNTREELKQAFDEYNAGTFVRKY